MAANHHLTLVGQAADSAYFYIDSFLEHPPSYALFPSEILSQWTSQVLYEVIVTPLTYIIVKSVEAS